MKRSTVHSNRTLSPNKYVQLWNIRFSEESYWCYTLNCHRFLGILVQKIQIWGPPAQSPQPIHKFQGSLEATLMVTDVLFCKRKLISSTSAHLGPIYTTFPISKNRTIPSYHDRPLSNHECLLPKSKTVSSTSKWQYHHLRSTSFVNLGQLEKCHGHHLLLPTCFSCHFANKNTIPGHCFPDAWSILFLC